MKPNSVAVALLSIAFAGCSAQQAAEPTQVPTMPEPAVATTSPILGATTPPAGARMGKRAPDDNTPPMMVFRAFGNEPFWNINVEGDTMTLTTPEDQHGMVMQGTRRSLPDGVEITGTHHGKPFVLTVTARECSDGMSDSQYQLLSSFRHADIDYAGCGELAK